jgi:(heptosyl)LPS beta-1,4-glucosyltransferase
MLEGDILHFTFKDSHAHLQQAKEFGRIGGKQLKGKGKLWLLMKWLASPAWRWFKMLVLKGGFKDGKEGFQIARITSYEVWLKYGIALGVIKIEES